MSLIETMVALALIGLVMGALALLFHRSFAVLRLLDEKERVRQVSRMGLDRMLNEVREATAIVEVGVGVLEFEKIDPSIPAVTPTPAPPPPPAAPEPTESYLPPTYTISDAYPDSSRLRVRYTVSNEILSRRVERLGGGGSQTQTVVDGVNSFEASQSTESPSEITVKLSARESQRFTDLMGRVSCPCLIRMREETP